MIFISLISSSSFLEAVPSPGCLYPTRCMRPPHPLEGKKSNQYVGLGPFFVLVINGLIQGQCFGGGKAFSTSVNWDIGVPYGLGSASVQLVPQQNVTAGFPEVAWINGFHFW